MSPLVTIIVAELVKQAPGLVIDLMQVLSKPDPTDADWAALRAKYAGKTAADYLAPALH